MYWFLKLICINDRQSWSLIRWGPGGDRPCKSHKGVNPQKTFTIQSRPFKLCEWFKLFPVSQSKNSDFSTQSIPYHNDKQDNKGATEWELIPKIRGNKHASLVRRGKTIRTLKIPQHEPLHYLIIEAIVVLAERTKIWKLILRFDHIWAPIPNSNI